MIIKIIADCGSSFYQLFFPRLCAACGQTLPAQLEVICVSCFAQLPYTRFALTSPNEITKRFEGRVNIAGALALLHFSRGGTVQHMMHQLKYRSAKQVGYFMGELIAPSIHSSNIPFDGIIPVPLHPAKERKRGFNQSDLIAEGLSKGTGIPVANDLIIRRQNNPSQTNKSRLDRWNNVREAFAWKGPSIIGKTYLIVDDVLTTGSTIEACAHLLLPENRVYLATFAYANL